MPAKRKLTPKLRAILKAKAKRKTASKTTTTKKRVVTKRKPVAKKRATTRPKVKLVIPTPQKPFLVEPRKRYTDAEKEEFIYAAAAHNGLDGYYLWLITLKNPKRYSERQRKDTLQYYVNYSYNVRNYLHVSYETEAAWDLITKKRAA